MRAPWTEIVLGAAFIGCASLAWRRAQPHGDTAVLEANQAAVRVTRESHTRGRPPERSPFRFASSSEVRPEQAPKSPALPTAPLPVLQLKGIGGGPPWHAIVHGFSSTPSDRVLRTGDRHDGIEVRAITAQYVEMTIGDSTWRLVLPERIQ